MTLKELKEKDPFWKVVEIMAILRGEGGCPWDREQTRESLKPYLIEETYEVLEAIDQGDPEKLKEELGDLLLQVVFHAQMAREQGEFDISQVLEGLAEKLIRRHPHVFGQTQVKDSQEVLENWEVIKGKEKNHQSALSGVPPHLPALLQAMRIQEKAARVGFDWSEVKEVWEKVDEEWKEFKDACQRGDREAMAWELGDLFFALVNLARFLGLDPEDALRQCNRRFMERFSHIENRLKEKGLSFQSVNLEIMDAFWEEAKSSEKRRDES